MSSPFLIPEDQLPPRQERGFHVQLFIISVLVVFIIGPMVAITGIWAFLQILAAFHGQ